MEKYKKTVQNNKLKITATTWNDDFELADGSYSVSDIPDYIEYIIKKHERLIAIPPIHVYINRISNSFKQKMDINYNFKLPKQ